jgi:hypothetical protein
MYITKQPFFNKNDAISDSSLSVQQTFVYL